jgi:hypothetical protein
VPDATVCLGFSVEPGDEINATELENVVVDVFSVQQIVPMTTRFWPSVAGKGSAPVSVPGLLDTAPGTFEFSLAWCSVMVFVKRNYAEPAAKALKLQRMEEICAIIYGSLADAKDPTKGEDVLDVVRANLFRPLWQFDARALQVEVEEHIVDPLIEDVRVAYAMLARCISVFGDVSLEFALRIAENVRSVDESERRLVVVALLDFVARNRRARLEPIVQRVLTIIDDLTRTGPAPPSASSALVILQQLIPTRVDVIAQRILPLVANEGLVHFRDPLVPWLVNVATGDVTFRDQVWSRVLRCFPKAGHAKTLVLLGLISKLGGVPYPRQRALVAVFAQVLERDDTVAVSQAFNVISSHVFEPVLANGSLRVLTQLLDVVVIATYSKAEGETARRVACWKTLRLIAKARQQVAREFRRGFRDRTARAVQKWERVAEMAGCELPPGAPKPQPLVKELVEDQKALAAMTAPGEAA